MGPAPKTLECEDLEDTLGGLLELLETSKGYRIPSSQETPNLQEALDDVYEQLCDRALSELQGSLQSYSPGVPAGKPYEVLEVPLGEL